MDLTFTRDYPQPVQTVWTALTDARAIRQWWMDTDFEPVVGREFFFQDKPSPGWDGRTVGRVLEVQAPARVRFTWVGGGIDTEVTYDLTPTATGGTRFTLTHSGFRGMRGLAVGTLLRFGWRGFVSRKLPEIAAHIAAAGIDAPFPTPPKAARAA